MSEDDPVFLSHIGSLSCEGLVDRVPHSAESASGQCCLTDRWEVHLDEGGLLWDVLPARSQNPRSPENLGWLRQNAPIRSRVLGEFLRRQHGNASQWRWDQRRLLGDHPQQSLDSSRGQSVDAVVACGVGLEEVGEFIDAPSWEQHRKDASCPGGPLAVEKLADEYGLLLKAATALG